jgi:hypothetical protein
MSKQIICLQVRTLRIVNAKNIQLAIGQTVPRTSFEFHYISMTCRLSFNGYLKLNTVEAPDSAMYPHRGVGFRYRIKSEIHVSSTTLRVYLL